MGLFLSGCGASIEPPDRDGAATDAGFTARDSALVTQDGAAVDAATPQPPTFDCAMEGTGELRVRLQLAPSVDASDLWIQALCGRTHNAGPSDELPVRLVRVPRGESMVTLSGLGEGYYRVVASATGAPAAASTVGVLRGATSTGTFVSVGASTMPTLTVESPMPVPDAGIAPMRDAAAPRPDASTDASTDAAVRPGPVAEFDVSSVPGSALGRVGVLLERRDEQWFDAAFKLQNICALMSCPNLLISAVELRVELAGRPSALVTINLAGSGRGTSLSAREDYDTPTRLVPATAIVPGARLRLTLFGSIDL